MYSRSRGTSGENLNIWPGFVDALSALLLVIMFVLLIFVVAQFYLSEILTGKDKSIDAFKSRLNELSLQLNFLESSKKNLESDLTSQKSKEMKLSLKNDDMKNCQQQPFVFVTVFVFVFISFTCSCECELVVFLTFL